MEIRTLNANEIECRIGTISARGCSLLLYKDARVDMKILDEVFGSGKWQRTHEVINGNLFCTIEIWNDEIKLWVKKQDVGKESFNEAQKGEASDSFKRAGFNVGIGRELYTAPFIWILPNNKQMGVKIKTTDDKTGEQVEVLREFYINSKGKYETKTKFYVSEIGYNDNREINLLIIKDNKDNVRFELIPQEEQRKRLNDMPITMTKIDMILSLVEEKKADIKNIHKKYGVKDITELTLKQGEEAIKILENQKVKGE